MSRHLAVGPDGGNLLGFLSALGALATLDRVWSQDTVKMCWAQHWGGWRPVFHLPKDISEEDILDAIYGELCKDQDPPGRDVLGEDLSVSPETFRAFIQQVALEAQPGKRRLADFAMAYGCEVTVDNGKIQDTALRTMSGAGHQHFLGSMAELGRLTTKADIAAALFRPWEYKDERPSMRWDPVDDRRYAYRADDPAKSKSYPIRTVRGANRLAIEALPLFPTAPDGKRLTTTGFPRPDSSRRGGRTRWLIRWPIWQVTIPLSVVRSLLTHPAVVGGEAPWAGLVAMGVVEVFEAERLTEGQFRNFTPSRGLIGGRTRASNPLSGA